MQPTQDLTTPPATRLRDSPWLRWFLVVAGSVLIGWYNGFLLAELLMWGIPFGLWLWFVARGERGSHMPSGAVRFARYLAWCTVPLLLSYLFQAVLVMPLAGVMYAASTRMITATKLREVGIALHDYHADSKHLPGPTIVDRTTARPLLSWRVTLLPYLEQDDLYRQFRLNEPWDSPRNAALLERMPDVYAPPRLGRPVPPGHTYLQLFVGPGALFEPGQQRTLEELHRRDGTSNTILAAWAARTVPWTKPEDISYVSDQPVPALGEVVGPFPFPIWNRLFWSGPFEFSTEVLWGDASIRGLRKHRLKDLNWEKLRPFITWSGGETVEWED